MSKIIAFEGLDGSGKTTQTNLLFEYFEKNNLHYKYLHFPRLNNSIVGDMIAKFLRGEFGKIEDVNPYFIALMYSVDRCNAKEEIQKCLENNQIVVIDRYVYSNIAFQCAKLEKVEERNILREWIIELEYKYNLIPKPDISFYLHVPFEFIANTLQNERRGNDRDYLNGLNDIHESSLFLQKQVEIQYIELAKQYDDFKLIDCLNTDEKLLSSTIINKMIIREIENIM